MLVTDLSDWNDHINWSHLIAAGVGGAIVKISEGRSLTQLHGKHIAGAEARGLPWGAYCYTHAQTTERAREEANRVIEALNALGYGTPPLGIWFDAEAPEVIGQGGYEYHSGTDRRTWIFPITFPNACLTAMNTLMRDGSSGDENYDTVYNLSRASLNYRSDNRCGSYRIAIGY